MHPSDAVVGGAPAGTAVAEWMDGVSARAAPALLELRGNELVVWSPARDAVYTRWSLAGLRVDALHEGGVAHLEHPSQPDAHLATSDAAFLAALGRAGAGSNALPRGRRRIAIGLGCAAAVAGLLAAVYLSAPWWSGFVARRIPIDVERRLAPEVGALFDGSTCAPNAFGPDLDRLVLRLDPGRSIPAQVRVVNFELPNAFALPGGVVLLTRGLIEQASGPDEVAGVLAHELAHVRYRHALAQMIQNALLSAIWAVTIGDYSGLLVVDPDTAYNIVTLRHSRRAEMEADEGALGMLDAGRISGRGLVAFFERHRAESSDDLAWLSTHPATGERLRVLNQHPVPLGATPSLDAAAFARLKQACQGQNPRDSWTDLFD